MAAEGGISETGEPLTDLCDESKCVSGGVGGVLNDDGVRFDCYVFKEHDEDALQCADGYVGRPIMTTDMQQQQQQQQEQVITVRRRQQRQRQLIEEEYNNNDGEIMKQTNHEDEDYYTCCPIDFDSDDSRTNTAIIGIVGRRHCSDPMPLKVARNIDDNNTESNSNNNTNNNKKLFDPMPCNSKEDETQQLYPRRMTSSVFYKDTYVCCDNLLPILVATNNNNSSIDNHTNNDTSVIITGNITIPTSSTPQPITISNDNKYICDESKCISQVKDYLHTQDPTGDFSPDYSCWAEGPTGLFTFDCSDGYEGVAVENEYSIFTDLISTNGGKILRYYTCCHPNYLNHTNNNEDTNTNTSATTPSTQPIIHRHCSEPIESYSDNDAMTCAKDGIHDSLKYSMPRERIFLSGGEVFQSYICCDDQPLDMLQDNEFRYEIDCVPCNSFSKEYNTCFINNKYGQLWAMICNDPEDIWTTKNQVVTQSSSSLSASSSSSDSYDNDVLFRFECCQSTADIPNLVPGPLHKDSSFRKTVCTQIFLSSVALLFSLSLFVALVYSIATKSKSARQKQQTRRRRTTVRQQDYTCYNLYLVYCAVPDILLSIFILVSYGRYIDQKWNAKFGGYIVDSVKWEDRKPLDNAFILACSTANTYINAFIAYDVYTLLNKSNNTTRYNPPSALNVSIKAVVCYVIACIVFLVRFFLEDDIAIDLQVWVYFFLCAGIPMIYILCVSAVIYKRGLLPSITGRVKYIALYYFRIILVFVFLWLPGTLLLAFSRKRYNELIDFDYNPKLFSIALIFCSLQPIFSTCMAMTKPDVREAVFNLYVTVPYTLLCCCFHSKDDNGNNNNNNRKNVVERPPIIEDNPEEEKFEETINTSVLTIASNNNIKQIVDQPAIIEDSSEEEKEFE